MKRVIVLLVILLLLVPLVLSLPPPPPPTPGGFGDSEDPNDNFLDELEDSPTESTDIKALEERIEALENKGLSIWILLLIALNIVLVGLIIYLMKYLHPTYHHK